MVADAPPSRFHELCADDFAALGRALAAVYKDRSAEGLQRASEYYVDAPPVSFTDETWRSLSANAQVAAEWWCPSAAPFFQGLTAGLGWSAYRILLDFEVYTLELQRQAAAKAKKRRLRQECDDGKEAALAALRHAVAARDEAAIAAARQAISQAKVLEAVALSSSGSSSGSSSSSGSDCGSSAGAGGSDAGIDGSSGDAGSSPSMVPKPDSLSAAGAAHAARRASGAPAAAEREGPVTRSMSARRARALAAPDASAAKVAGSVQNGRCTGFASVSELGAVVAQTADLPPGLYGYGDYDCVLKLTVGASSVLVYDVDGRLCPIGLNSAGLAIAVFNLHLSDTGGFDGPALTVQSIVWELLLGQHTLPSATAWLRSLPPMMCGCGLLLADADVGSLCVELRAGPGGRAFLGEPSPWVTRANHPEQEGCEAAYGEGPKTRKESEVRQGLLAMELVKSAGKAGLKRLGGGGIGERERDTYGSQFRRSRACPQRMTPQHSILSVSSHGTHL